jgi:hypothetical protein
MALGSVLAITTGARGGQPEAAEPGHPVQIVPNPVIVDEWAAGTSVEVPVWVINDGPRTTRVRSAEPADPAVRMVDFDAFTLAPAGATQVRLSVTAPPEGESREHAVTFGFDDNPPLALQVQITGIHPDVHLPDPVLEPGGTDLRAAPPTLDLGWGGPGQRRVGSLWLINTAATPLRLSAAKGSCGCLTIEGFEPGDLAPGHARRLQVSMTGATKTGQRRKYLTFLTEGQESLIVDVWLTTLDPLEARLRRYLEARDGGHRALARAYLAPDARMWFGERSGTGQPLLDGEGPWADWDRQMRTRRRYLSFDVAEGVVTVDVEVDNDFYALLDRPPKRSRITYTLDAEQSIEGILVQDEDEIDRGRFDEFLRWARQEAPAELAEIYPAGEILPTAASARRWRILLERWRSASGLPHPERP